VVCDWCLVSTVRLALKLLSVYTQKEFKCCSYVNDCAAMVCFVNTRGPARVCVQVTCLRFELKCESVTQSLCIGDSL
jgi:hypothetical protein